MTINSQNNITKVRGVTFNQEGHPPINKSTDIRDSSGTGKYIIPNNIYHDPNNKKIDNSSIYIPNESIKLNAQPDFDFGSNNFTIDFWIKWKTSTSNNQNLIDYWGSSGEYSLQMLYVYASNIIDVYVSWNGTANTNTNFSFTPVLDTWYHIALVRNSTNLYSFVDGILKDTYSVSTNSFKTLDGTSNHMIFGNNINDSNNFDGYYDEIRISDTARWTSAFTPPTSAYTSDANTVLLIHSNETEIVSEGDCWYNPADKKISVFNDGKFTAGNGYGYCIGNNNSSIIERISFPFNDGNAIHIGNLAQSKRTSAGCNSSIHGFIIGGWTGSYLSNVDRIEFPFNSGTSILIGNLLGTKSASGGCNSSIHGYCMGGHDGSIHSTIERIEFPFNSGSSINIGNLSYSTYYPATFNSSIHGYSSSGFASTSIINRITFPHDSGTANHVGNCAHTKYGAAGCNSSIHGYTMGGYNTSAYISIIDKIEFPFNSGTATNVGNLNQSKNYGSTCNSAINGYYMGGVTGSYFSNIDRISFPHDSGTSVFIGNLTENKIIVTGGIDNTDFVSQFV